MWRNCFPWRTAPIVIDDDRKEKTSVKKELAKIRRSSWRLVSNKTAQFYNGHPEFDIVAGQRFKIIAEYRLVISSIFGLYADVDSHLYMVEIAHRVLEVDSSLVRVIVKKKKGK